MKKTASRREALFLNTVCSDSGVCLAFGKEKDKIQRFFEFDTFTYAYPVYKRVGNRSVNAFICEVQYEREHYRAHAILKSSVEMYSDNLSYEYLVGQTLNQANRWLPSFVETYGLFYYTTSDERLKVLKNPAVLSLYNKKDKQKNKKNVAKLTPLNPGNIQDVCKTSARQCLLIQHIKDAVCVQDKMNDKMFVMYDLLYVLYPVYFSLKCLRTVFTHYDLHGENVLLYEPIKGGYIEYHIHTKEEEVVFRSKYIAKIIDYGSSFVQGSMDYYNKLCAEKLYCGDCGNQVGFYNFAKDRSKDSEKYFINSLYKNESHDLRLLSECVHLLPMQSSQMPHVQAFIHLLKSTVYEVGIRDRDASHFGTIEDLSVTDKINNVSSAEKKLRAFIKFRTWQIVNETQYRTLRKIGELHIYEDQTPMRYIEEPVQSFHI